MICSTRMLWILIKWFFATTSKTMDVFDTTAGSSLSTRLRNFQQSNSSTHIFLSSRFIHRSIEDEDHYQIYGVFPIPTERPQTNVMSQPEHHVAQPVHAPPPSHMNYYSNCDNMIANQPPQSNQTAQAFPQNSTMPMISRRRSFGMADSNIEPMIPQKRPHLEEIRTAAVTTVTYNGQNNDNSHQCRYVEPNIGQTMNGIPTTVPNSVAQVQPPHVSAPAVTSVVISEDVINIYRLYEEHNLLRRRVEINEERLQELRATNTYLLQQNEQLRRQIQCSCANTIVNPVTLTTASQPTATPVIYWYPHDKFNTWFTKFRYSWIGFERRFNSTGASTSDSNR